MAEPRTDFEKRAHRPWRIAFVIYALALTIGTHWPHLQLGTEDYPVSDKLVHTAAFGGLMLLLLRTSWLTRRWQAALAAAIWAGVDEVSQGIPGLGRDVLPDDFVAGLCGIVIVWAFAWALRPRGAGAALIHETRWRLAIQRMFLRPWVWMVVGAAGLTGILIGVPISLLLTQLFVNPNPRQAFVIGLVIGAMALGHFTIEVLRRREVRLMKVEWPCFACNASLADVDNTADGRCIVCDAAYHPRQWDDPPRLSPMFFRKIVLTAFVAWWALVVLGFLALVGLLSAAMTFSWARSLDNLYRSFGPDLSIVFDSTGLGVLAAIALSWVRGRIARRLDRQDNQCVQCDYDLHATEHNVAHGVCPECGEAFATVGSLPRED